MANKNLEYNIKAVEKLKNRSIDTFEKDDFITLFQEFTAISQKYFYSLKSNIKKYIREKYGEDCPSIDILSKISFADTYEETAESSVYFSSFAHLNDTLKLAIENSNMIPDAHDTAVACIYLAWAGFTAEEAIRLPKRSISENYNQISGDRIINTNETIMKFLRRYKKSKGYYRRFYGTNRPGWVEYKDSEYLLRQVKKAEFTVADIANKIVAFNKETNMKNRFLYTYIYQSGIYSRMYEKEREIGLLPDILGKRKVREEDKALYEQLLERKFDDNHKLFTQIRQYQRWIKCFH